MTGLPFGRGGARPGGDGTAPGLAGTLVTACLGMLLSTCTLAGTLAVVGGTVIDGTGGPPRPDTTVLIEGERIGALFPAGAQALPPDARIVDARGRWVIRGLIDAHVHFFQSGGLYTRPDVILDADPLADIRNTRQIHAVIKGGQVVVDGADQPRGRLGPAAGQGARAGDPPADRSAAPFEPVNTVGVPGR